MNKKVKGIHIDEIGVVSMKDPNSTRGSTDWLVNTDINALVVVLDDDLNSQRNRVVIRRNGADVEKIIYNGKEYKV